MKFKTLIVPVVATMLAVSCGDAPAAKDWSKEQKDYMTAEFGVVLPYIDFDAESLVWDEAKDEFGGSFLAHDANATNLTATYGEKLVSAGFVFDEKSEGYYKETEKSTLQVYIGFVPADEGEEKGQNYIDVEYLYNESPTGTWSNEVQAMMMASVGELLPYAFFDVETTVVGSSTGMQFYMYDDNYDNKLVSYGSRLVNAGWEEYLDYYSNEIYYEKTFEDRTVQVYPSYFEMEGYVPGNEIDITVVERDFDFFPSSLVEMAISYASNRALAPSIPDFEPKSEDVYYTYEEDASRQGAYSESYIYAYNTTSEDLAAYVGALVDEGFHLVFDDGEDYLLQMPGTGLSATLVDFTVVPEPDPEEGGEGGDVPPAPAPAVLRGEGEEAGEGEEEPAEEPAEEPTACICFAYDGTESYALSNKAVAQTIAYKLGLPMSVVEEKTVEKTEAVYYEIYYEFKDTTTVELEALAKAAVPEQYFFSAEDSGSWEDEDNPEVTDYYEVFYVDDYVEGGQMVQYQIVSYEGDATVSVLWLQVLGEPIELSWTAYTAAEAFINYWNSLLGQDFKPEDISEIIKISPAYGLSLTLTVEGGAPASVNTLATYCGYALNGLLGFEFGQWTASEEEEGTYIKTGTWKNVVVMVSIAEGEFTIIAYETPSDTGPLE